MSYEITYRKCVVKNKHGLVIPILEVGCSNVWEVARNRRSRDWGIFTKRVGHESVQKKQVHEYWREYYQEKYPDWLDQNTQRVASWRFPGSGKFKSAISYITNVNIDYDLALEHIRICGKNIDEFETLEDINASRDIDDTGNWIERSLYGCDSCLYEMSKRNKVKRNAKKLENYKQYDPYKKRRVVKIDNGYALKMGSRRLSYTYYRDSGKMFDSENKAKKRAEKINTRFNVNARIEAYQKEKQS